MGGGIIGQLRPQLQNVIQNQDHHEHLEYFSKTLWEKLIICKHYKRRRVPKKAKSKFFNIYLILTSPAQDGIFLIGFHPHAPSQLVCSSFFARSKRNSHHFVQKLHIDEPWQSCSSHHKIAICIGFWFYLWLSICQTQSKQNEYSHFAGQSFHVQTFLPLEPLLKWKRAKSLWVVLNLVQ